MPEVHEEELALLNLGFKLDSEGRFEEEVFLDAANANLILAPRAYFGRGLIFRELNQIDNGKREFQRVLEIAPFNSSASYFLYSALCSEGKLEEAMAEGRRFFDGRKSTKTSQLILDYEKSLNNLVNYEELEEYRAAALRNNKPRKSAKPDRERAKSKRAKP